MSGRRRSGGTRKGTLRFKKAVSLDTTAQYRYTFGRHVGKFSRNMSTKLYKQVARKFLWTDDALINATNIGTSGGVGENCVCISNTLAGFSDLSSIFNMLAANQMNQTPMQSFQTIPTTTTTSPYIGDQAPGYQNTATGNWSGLGTPRWATGNWNAYLDSISNFIHYKNNSSSAIWVEQWEACPKKDVKASWFSSAYGFSAQNDPALSAYGAGNFGLLATNSNVSGSNAQLSGFFNPITNIQLTLGQCGVYNAYFATRNFKKFKVQAGGSWTARVTVRNKWLNPVKLQVGFIDSFRGLTRTLMTRAYGDLAINITPSPHQIVVPQIAIAVYEVTKAIVYNKIQPQVAIYNNTQALGNNAGIGAFIESVGELPETGVYVPSLIA